jgi:nucleoside diphosphate kinase
LEGGLGIKFAVAALFNYISTIFIAPYDNATKRARADSDDKLVEHFKTPQELRIANELLREMRIERDGEVDLNDADTLNDLLKRAADRKQKAEERRERTEKAAKDFAAEVKKSKLGEILTYGLTQGRLEYAWKEIEEMGKEYDKQVEKFKKELARQRSLLHPDEAEDIEKDYLGDIEKRYLSVREIIQDSIAVQNKNTGVDEAAVGKQKAIDDLFKEKGLKDGFQIGGKNAYESKITPGAIREFIEKLESIEGLDIAELEGRDISLSRIKKINGYKSEKWINRIIKEFGLSMDYVLEPPVAIKTVREAFEKTGPVKLIMSFIKQNFAPYAEKKSIINSVQIIVSHPDTAFRKVSSKDLALDSKEASAKDLDPDLIEASSMMKVGVNSVVMRMADKKPSGYQEISPNTMVTKEIDGEVYEFKVEHSVDKKSFKRWPEIVTVVKPNRKMQENLKKSGYSDKDIENIYKTLYIESAEDFAIDIDGSIQLKTLGISGAGSIIYGRGINLDPAAQQKTSIAKYDWDEFKNVAKFYDDNGNASAKGIEDFFTEIKVIRTNGRNADPKSYGRSLDARENGNNLKASASAERFFNADRSRGVTESKILLKDVKKTVDEVYDMKGSGEDYDKLSNFLSQGKDIRKTIEVKLSDLDADLAAKIYKIGFDGINVILSENDDLGELKEKLGRLSEAAKKNGIGSQNYITLTSELMEAFKGKIFEGLNLSDIIGNLPETIMPNVKVTAANADNNAVKSAVALTVGPKFDKNFAVELAEISGDELNDIEKISVVWLSNPSGIKEARKKFKSASGKSFAETYRDAYKTSAQDTDYLASFDAQKTFDADAREGFRRYMSPEISSVEAADIETAFKAMKAFAKSVGIAENSFAYKDINYLSAKPTQDSYAKAKAHFRNAVENYLEALYLKAKNIEETGVYDAYIKKVSVEDRNAVKSLLVFMLINGESAVEFEVDHIVNKYKISSGKENMTVRDLRVSVSEFINKIKDNPFASAAVGEIEKAREAGAILNISAVFIFDKILRDARAGAQISGVAIRSILAAA